MKKSMFLSLVVALALIPAVAMAGMSVMTAEELEAIDGQASIVITLPATATIEAQIDGVSYRDGSGFTGATVAGWFNIDAETAAGADSTLPVNIALGGETITVNVGTTTPGGISQAEIVISGMNVTVPTPPAELAFGIDSSTTMANRVGSLSLDALTVTVTGGMTILIIAN